MKTLRIGGVPEHFNLPWHEALRAGGGAIADVSCEWRDYPGGTGAMVEALESEQLDAALLLTEGAVAGIARGAGFRIVSFYTQSPLRWGIHVPGASGFAAVAQLEGARFAISRFGSGSHLMAYVLADREGWPREGLEFVTVGSLDGAVQAFAEGGAEVFLWERFMTQPLVTQEAFKRLDELVAPWPAFVVCAAREALRTKRTELAAVLERVFETAAALAAAPGAAERIATGYGIDPGDAAAWLERTRWAEGVGVDEDRLGAALSVLQQVGVVDPRFAGTLAQTL